MKDCLAPNDQLFLVIFVSVGTDACGSLCELFLVTNHLLRQTLQLNTIFNIKIFLRVFLSDSFFEIHLFFFLLFFVRLVPMHMGHYVKFCVALVFHSLLIISNSKFLASGVDGAEASFEASSSLASSSSSVSSSGSGCFSVPQLLL